MRLGLPVAVIACSIAVASAQSPAPAPSPAPAAAPSATPSGAGLAGGRNSSPACAWPRWHRKQFTLGLSSSSALIFFR